MLRIHENITDRGFSARKVAWSVQDHPEAWLQIREIRQYAGETEIWFNFDSKSGHISIPFIDNASIENAIHCLVACLYLKMDLNDLASRFMELMPVAMRLEVKKVSLGV